MKNDKSYLEKIKKEFYNKVKNWNWNDIEDIKIESKYRIPKKFKVKL